MQRIWYLFVKVYIKLGLYAYYKNISVVGTEHIPKQGAVLFVCNHQNALIDPLLLATHTKRSLHFLTRAGVFGNAFLNKLFSSLQMLPIYRVRDGWQSLAKNQAIFDKCYNILAEEKSLLIFPEGSHNIIRRVRPLSKGFTRIVFGTLEKHPELQLQIVPVGMNFSSVSEHPSKVGIYFGAPILANNYLNKSNFDATKDLKEEVHTAMSLLTTHIEGSQKHYDIVIESLTSKGVDFSKPFTNFEIVKIKKNSKSKFNLIHLLFKILFALPWFIWNRVQLKILEIEFKSTFRFALGITIFPIWILLSFVVINSIMGVIPATIVSLIFIIIGLLNSKRS
ncbi:hypothetical protein KH5_22010 [Urechidicola sp. KH5]